MSKVIAVIGSGGREHALSWKLLGEGHTVYTLPGNGGIQNSVNIDPSDFEAVEKFCRKEQVDLVVVGPENFLAAGIVDYLRSRGISAFGPTKEAAQLESSKIFSKQFMKNHGVSTADFFTTSNRSEALGVVEKLEKCVLKYDGLAAGKGVFVCRNREQSFTAIESLCKTFGENCPLIIEELLEGNEISIIGVTDGNTFLSFPPSQDHKQLLDGDLGPNTGGMGAYTPVPNVSEKLMNDIKARIIDPTMKGLCKENFDYKGFIYFGVMVSAEGPYLLEYNVRLGDPEAEVLLPAIESNLAEIIESCLCADLAKQKISFNDGYFADVVMVSGGYPKGYHSGYEIHGVESAKDVLLLHSGTKQDNGTIVTAGGRVLNVIGNGSTLAAAIEKVYQQIKNITFEDSFYRHDIGKRENEVIRKYK